MKCFKNYLSNGQQYVNNGFVTSDYLNKSNGMSQGSVLGPIFVNKDL